MTITIITKAETVRSAPARWQEQYEGYKSMEAKTASVSALPEGFTAEDFEAIAGNRSWTTIHCDECDQEVEAVARLGETEYPARWMYVCASCLDIASRAIANDGWRPIETADKDSRQLMLGIVRQGLIEEIHVGGYRYAYNEDEVSCWWSDQCDDEIVPTHWRPLPAAPAISTEEQRASA